MLINSTVTTLRRNGLIRTITSRTTEDADEGDSINSAEIVNFVIVSETTSADHERNEEQPFLVI